MSWKSVGDCVRNGVIPYSASAMLRNIEKWSGIRIRDRITTKSSSFRLVIWWRIITSSFNEIGWFTFAVILHTGRIERLAYKLTWSHNLRFGRGKNWGGGGWLITFGGLCPYLTLEPLLWGKVSDDVWWCDWQQRRAVITVSGRSSRLPVIRRLTKSSSWRRHATAGCGSAAASNTTSASSVVRPTCSGSPTPCAPAGGAVKSLCRTRRLTASTRVSLNLSPTCPPATGVLKVLPSNDVRRFRCLKYSIVNMSARLG